MSISLHLVRQGIASRGHKSNGPTPEMTGTAEFPFSDTNPVKNFLNP